MQKRNRKLLSISAAALIMASAGAGLGQTVHATGTDSSDLNDKSDKGADIFGKDGFSFGDNNDAKTNLDSEAKIDRSNFGSKLSNSASSLGTGKSADVGQIDNDVDKFDASQNYSLKDLQNLIKSASSDAEISRVSHVSKEMQDKFESALSDAKTAKTDKDVSASYVVLANIMDQIDQSLKSGLKSSLEKTQGDDFQQALFKLDSKSGDQAEQDARGVIKTAFMSSFNVAKQVYADPLASVNSIKLAGENLDIYRNIVLGAGGDSKALDEAKLDVAKQKQELSDDQIAQANEANSELDKAIGANAKSETMTYLAKSVDAMNKASEDRGLSYLISDAQDFIKSNNFKDLDNNQKLDLLTSLNNAEAVEQNPLATPLMRAQAKNSLMNDLALGQDGISPKTHLADSIKRAQALSKSNAFGKNASKVQAALAQAEAAQKSGDKAQQEKAAKALDDAMQTGLSSEVTALKAQFKKLSAKKASKKAGKSKSGKSDGDSNSDANGSDSSDSSNGSGDSSDSNGSTSGKSKKDKDKSDGDSNSDSDSDGNSRDDAPATKTERAKSEALPQTGRFILQHALVIAGVFAALAGIFGLWLYNDKKRKAEKDSNK